MKLLRFKTFDFETFKKEYEARCEEKHDTRKVWENNLVRDTAADFVTLGMIPREEMDGLRITDESEAPVIRKPLRTTNETRLKEKTYYLMDEVIYRSVRFTKGDPEIPKMAIMNALVMKNVIGRDYKPILESFMALNYLEGSGAYNHKTAKMYKVIDEIEDYDCPREHERKIAEYEKKTGELLTKARKKQQAETLARLMKQDNPGATKETADRFLDRYTKDLNKIKIADEEGLNRAIGQRREVAKTEMNQKGELKDPGQIDIYYDMMQRELRGPKDIHKIDPQGRIYHFLTTLKRELKDYLTISFSIDCKNSHPLLFNHILFNSYLIDTGTALEISRLMGQLFISLKGMDGAAEYHYVGKSIRKYLIDNGIKESDIALFPDDALLFVFETTTGTFWDNICKAHPEYDRSEIKQKMFAEVFYSNTSCTTYKEYGRIFEDRYPNVYGEITRWKAPEKSPYIRKYLDKNGIVVEKSTASLSIALMALESKIFRAALASLYRRRFHAVHIHDCIVIPAGSKHQPTPEEVKKILLKEYKKYGLIPTLKVE